MNRFRPLLSTPLLAALAVAGLAWVATAQQREPAAQTEPAAQPEAAELSAAQTRTIRTAAKNARPVSIHAVVQRRTGSLDKVDGYLAEFMKEFEGQGLSERLEGFEPTSVLILYEDPAGKGEVPLAVGLTVPGSPEVKKPLTVERFFEDQAVRVTHTGPYQQLGQVHRVIAESVREGSRSTSAAAFPVILRLLNDPELVRPEQIRSELIVPVESEGPVTLTRETSTAIRRAVSAPQKVSEWIVSQTFEGSVEQTGEFLEKFMDAFTAQGLGDKLSGPDVAPFAILHGNPDQEKSIKIEIGFPVTAKVEVKAPLALRELSLPQAVRVTHSGDYDELGAVYGQIEKAAASLTSTADPGWPVALRLLTDPREADSPRQIRTEMIVPLEGSKG